MFKDQRLVRLRHNDSPPELSLSDGHQYHLFLSHVWATGQVPTLTLTLAIASALTLISSWDPDGHIPDYASRLWGGARRC